MKEVSFKKYCPICKYRNKKQSDEPCETCLGVPTRYGTERPEKFEKK